jgi:hypothetical protein
MTLNMENDNVVIVYALQKIISYARNNQYICVNQSVWWTSSIVGLYSGLIIHMDNFKAQINISALKISNTPRDSRRQLDNDKVPQQTHPQWASHIRDLISTGSTSENSLSDPSEDDIHN